MKINKIIAIVAIVLAFTACSKVDKEKTEKEIAFQVANHLETKANVGVKYENGNFGTYSWFSGTQDYMINQEVGLKDGAWKTLHNTYYWPKTGAITFISYSPFSGENGQGNSTPTVTRSGNNFALAYGSASSPYTVGSDDLMYADVATCSANVDELTDDADGSVDSGYTGVPTLFRHALAKVRFEAYTGALQAGTAPDVTRWEVSIKSASVKGLKNAGTLNMQWNGTEWAKPTGNVWTNPSGNVEKALKSNVNLSETPVAIGDLGLVLPQTLANQTLVLDIHIKTILPGGLSIEEDLTAEANIADFSDEIKSWKMNQSIIYRIKINPTGSETPVAILFDPAVDGWEELTADYTMPF